MVRGELVEGLDFSEGGKLGHHVDLPEELPDDLAGILALTQAIDLAHRL